ncbi:MAG TPA: diacylglycerol kinase family protein [Anaerolineales bacterium]
MHAVLIANPTAGRRQPDASPERIAAMLRDAGLEVEVCTTARRGDAVEFARAAASHGADRIVIAGGDGTISEVANGLIGQQVPAAIIPCGTANVLANELDLPQDVAEACNAAAAGRPRRIDLGTCNGRAFFLAAGIGLDAALVRAVPPNLKRRLGIAAYWITAARVLPTVRAARYSLRIDGRSRSDSLFGAIVCGTRFYAGRYQMAPNARPDDGLLDLVLIHSCGRLNLLRAGLAMVTGRAATCPLFESVPVQTVDCEAEPAAPVQLDGDDFGDTPVSIRLESGAFTVIVPATSDAPARPRT